MSDKDVIYRWMTQAELERMVENAANMAVDLAVRGVLAMDSHVYDEDTIRAAAMVVRESIQRKS
jgi:hypothetical protein